MAYTEGGEGVGYYSFGSVRTQAAIQVDVWNVNDTTAHVKIQGWVRCISGALSEWGTAIQVGHGEINGAGADWHEGGAVYNYGNWVGPYIHEYDVPRGIQDNNLTCWVKYWGKTVNGYGGARNSGGLYMSVTIPHRQWHVPSAPTNVSATRRSDNQSTLTWDASFTGPGDAYPITAFNIERSTDANAFTQIARVNWDVQNYTDNSITQNHRYQYRVCQVGYAGNSTFGNSNIFYTTPNAPKSVTATKTTTTQVRIAVDTSTCPMAQTFLVQQSVNSDAWSNVGTYSAFPITVSAPSGTVTYRVQAQNGTLVSGYTTSNSVTTIATPNPPSVSVSPQVARIGESIVVSWVPNHIDGTTQQSAYVEYSYTGQSAKTVYISGSTTTYTLPSAVSAQAGTVTVRVRTKGLASSYSNYSSYVSITVAQPPQGYFSSPASDSTKIAGVPLTATWSVTDDSGVAAQSISLASEDGSILYRKTLDTDTRSLVIDNSVYPLENMRTYALTLEVTGGSTLKTMITRTFLTRFAEPAPPTASVTLDEEHMSYSITVSDGKDIQPYATDRGDVIVITDKAGQLLPGLTIEQSSNNVLANGSLTITEVDGTKQVLQISIPSTYRVSGAVYKVNGAGEMYRYLSGSTTPNPSTPITTVTLPEYKSNSVTISWSASYTTASSSSTYRSRVQLGYPETTSLALVREDVEGVTFTIAENMSSGTNAIDPLPPINADFVYRLIATTATGATSTVRLVQNTGIPAIGINAGRGARLAEVFTYDPQWDESSERETELFYFADGGVLGGLPMAYGGETISVTHSLGATILDKEQFERIRALAKQFTVFWVRDPYGHRYLCSVHFSFSAGVNHEIIEMSASATETVFEDAW